MGKTLFNPVQYYNKQVGIKHTLLRILNKENHIRLTGLFLLKYRSKDCPRNLQLAVGEHEYKISEIFNAKRIFNMRVLLYSAEIPYKDIIDSDVHNPLYILANRKDGKGFKRRVPYIIFPKRSLLLHGPIKVIEKQNVSIMARQGRKNYIYLTAREINKTDSWKEGVKIFLAFILSRLLFFQKSVVLFEKECEKYEESASTVYEKLIERDNKGIYFILDRDSRKKYSISNKYKKNILDKYSFGHYLKFFQSKLFLSTETPYHAVELRTLNRFIHFKLRYMKYKYVFLQHGVMFMVSLDSATRKTFRYGSIFKSNARIVVSSELEAQHFIEYGNYPRENLIVSGLPKFDKSIRYKSADKIVIMPTWRPWEFTDLRIDAKSTAYYQMIKDIFDAVPNNLKEKVIVLPHPLVIEAIKNTELSKYFPQQINYEEILRNTEILITDYSSIAYDAFYRGAKTIFWWKEKEECIKEYQGFLMLNEKNIFGDIVYDKKTLSKRVEDSYKKAQEPQYIERYKKIVEFSDNENTERLLTILEKEKFL